MRLQVMNFKETKREQRIRQIDDELKVIEMYRGLGDKAVSVDAEDYFRAWVAGRHGHKVIRSGWPDFLLQHSRTGEVFAVEVKSWKDKLSKSQFRCFSLLEKAGIRVYVWSPAKPKLLTPWRSFLKDKDGKLRIEQPRVRGKSKQTPATV